MVIYFSGTGNSRLCARVIAKALGDETMDSFAFLRRREAMEEQSSKPWVFAAPIHAWRLPKVFEDLLRRSRFTGCRDAYFVITCGSEIGGVEGSLRALCNTLQLNFRGVMAIPMPNNYMLFSDLDTPEEAEAILTAARVKMEKAAQLIALGSPFPKEKSGLLGRLQSAAVGPLFARFATSADPFVATDKCISCGKCARHCPMGNIEMEDGRPDWDDDCCLCLSCINICPEQAIEYGKSTRGKRRYYCHLDE